MFEDTILAVFVFILYWGHIIPYAYEYAKSKTWVQFDFGKIKATYFPLMIFIFIGATTYILFNRTAMGVHRKFREFDKHSLLKMKRKLKQKVEAIDIEKQATKTASLDAPDGKRYRRGKTRF